MDQPRPEKSPFTERKPRQNSGQPRILVAPLDWGLGHATRCIPLIRELLRQNADVWIAAEGAQEIVLKEEFPDLRFLRLEGYKARYARTKAGLLWQMLVQSPKFLRVIEKEHSWLKKVVKEYGFDAVISDNRYGLHYPGIPSIFITHQLTIKSPLGKWSERFLQKRNYRYINRFTECWVPDEEHNSLAANLSHPEKKPAVPLRFIGHLSRLEKKEIEEIKNHLLVILSGPEPQRSLLENSIVAQISHYNGTATVVRGLPGASSLIPSTNMIRFYNHLPADELNVEMQKAEYVISRSGYSTVMDLAALQKKSILIPTPGQTEQEYLALHLSNNHFAVCVQQNDFSLVKDLQQAKAFAYRLPALPATNSLRSVIQSFISSLH